jgi:hypothetical protein
MPAAISAKFLPAALADLAREARSPLDEAEALAGLGRARAAGHADEADSWLRQALEIFQRTGAAEATQVSAELDVLAASAGPSLVGP